MTNNPPRSFVLYLCLKVVTRDYVADGAQCGRLHGRRGVDQQLYQALAHPSLDDSLNFVILTVGQVAQGPARVGQYLDKRKSQGRSQFCYGANEAQKVFHIRARLFQRVMTCYRTTSQASTEQFA